MTDRTKTGLGLTLAVPHVGAAMLFRERLRDCVPVSLGDVLRLGLVGNPAHLDAILTVPHPSVGLRADAARRLHVWMREFGLSPDSRSRAKAPEDQDATDPLALLLGGRDDD